MISPIGIFAEVIVFLFGMWIGWLLTKPESGEDTVGWREMWRHGPSPLYYRNQKSGRVLFGAFGGFLAAWGLRALGDYLDSTALNLIAVGAALVSIGIGWGVLLFHGPLKRG